MHHRVSIKQFSPKTEHPDNAGVLIDEGLSVARLNFSHGDHEEHRGQMRGVREALKTRPGAHSSILLDTKGPEIRTGNMEGGKPITLERGQLLELSKNLLIKPLTIRTLETAKGSPAPIKIWSVQPRLERRYFSLMAVFLQS